jgi:hypothetical protein
MGFGLMIGFIGLFDTGHDTHFTYLSLSLTHTIIHIYVFTSHRSVAAYTGSVPLPPGSRHQLPVS